MTNTAVIQHAKGYSDTGNKNYDDLVKLIKQREENCGM